MAGRRPLRGMKPAYGLLNFGSSMSAWASWDSRRKIFAIAVATVAVISIAYALDIRYLILGPQGVTAVDDIGEAGGGGAAGGGGGLGAEGPAGGGRVAWAPLGLPTGQGGGRREPLAILRGGAGDGRAC